MYRLVRELAVDGIPVAVTCRVLKIARQPYYRSLANPVTDAELTAAYRANALFDAHRDDPEFGYRFLVEEARDAGEPMAERTAWRTCSDLGWWSAFEKKRGKNGKKPDPPVHNDRCAVVDDKGRVRHEFSTAGPNELWLADITEHWTGEGKLYVCAIKDVSSNRIVGYSIDSRMKSRLAVAAVNHAVARRQVEDGDVAGCVLHTDRGRSFVAGSSSTRSTVTPWSARWAAWARLATTLQWSRSFRCCRRTSSTAVLGRHGRSCGSRSSGGLRGPTTAAGGSRRWHG